MSALIRLRAYALAELALVLAITGVGLVVLIGIGNMLLDTFQSSGGVDDVRRLVRVIDRYGGPGLDMTDVGTDALIDASLLPPRMIDPARRVLIARRYPVTLRGAMHSAHGLAGTQAVPFVPRDPLSYVLSVGSSLAPVADVASCIALFSPILDRNLSRSLPPVRVTYALVEPSVPSPGTPDPPPPPPLRPWSVPVTWWPSAYAVPGAPPGLVWYVSPHPAMAPDAAPGPELYSRIAEACHRLLEGGRGVLVYYGVSSL